MAYKPIKRTAKANVVSPEIFCFKFITEPVGADGYGEAGGVDIETTATDGYYKAILPRGYTTNQLMFSQAEVLLDTADSTPGVGAAVVALEPGILYIATYTDLSQTVGVIPDATIQVLLFFKGGS